MNRTSWIFGLPLRLAAVALLALGFSTLPRVAAADAEAVTAAIKAIEQLEDEGQFTQALREAKGLRNTVKDSAAGAQLKELIGRLTAAEEAVTELEFAIEQLGSSEARTRRIARQKIKNAGNAGTILLRKAMREEKGGGANEVARVLAEIGDARDVPLLFARLLKDPTTPANVELAKALRASARQLTANDVTQVYARIRGAPDPLALRHLMGLLSVVYRTTCGGNDDEFCKLVEDPAATRNLKTYVQKARESTDPDLRAWAVTDGTAFVTELFAWWKLDEKTGLVAADASGNKLDGTLQGGPQWATVSGRAGLSFDGVDDVVVTPTHLDGLAVPFSIALWVNPAPAQVEYADILGSHSGPQGLVIQQDSTKTNLFGFGYADGKQWYSPGAAQQLTAGQWQHLAVVCDLETAFFYVNGELKTSAPAKGTLAPNPGLTFRLGQGFVTGRFLKGLLSDVRIYRGALIPAQVETLARRAGAAPAGGAVPAGGAKPAKP